MRFWIQCGVVILTILFHRSNSEDSCDFFHGRWVRDSSYPLYNSTACPFVQKEFSCQKNGLADESYLHYSWQPNGCSLPRFNGVELLRRLKGKSIMFVGDSLSRNQWHSLLCMLYTAVPGTKYNKTSSDDVSTFTFKEFGVKVMVDRNVFLVDVVREPKGRILKLDSIEGGKLWKGIDMLVFNTWHWWNRRGPTQPGSFWGEPRAKSCSGQKEPLLGSTYPGGLPPALTVLKRVLSTIKKPAELLDVTNLSLLRKDGHPSIYGLGGEAEMDCSHWCLPGVPDTWNQILYSLIL